MSTVPNTLLQEDADDSVSVTVRALYTTYTGTDGDDSITGTTQRDVLIGGAGDDVIDGKGGYDTFIGGAGADTLITSPSYNGSKFVYNTVTDSYSHAGVSHSDLIENFGADDVLDLTALGLERVGNGHNGDLAVTYDADENITYVRSLDKDADGNAFEVRLAGNYEGKLGTQNFVLSYDLADPDARFTYHSLKQYHITGTDADDTIHAAKYNSSVDGGAGADHLASGIYLTTFVYDGVSDSFVNDTTGTSSVDVITSLKATGDVLDVSALGFTGLGDGYNGTLNYAYDKTLGHMVAQSFEADAQGNRFVVYVDQDGSGSVSGIHDVDRFVFAGDGTGDPATQTLTGDDTYDRLYNPDSGGIMIGNGSGDALSGGSGVDTFRYLDKSDSVRYAADLIANFDVAQDKIDVSALGYTGLGDGTDGTLKVVYDKADHRTYLKDYDAGADGQRFEISLEGNFAKTFTADNLIVAAGAEQADAVHVDLVGVAAGDAHLAG